MLPVRIAFPKRASSAFSGYDIVGISHPSFYLVVRHVVIEADAYPMLGTHVVRSAYGHVAGFQFVYSVGIAFDGAGIEAVDVEEAENPASDIKRQDGLRGPKCLKRHLLAAARQGEAKFPEFLYIHPRLFR